MYCCLMQFESSDYLTIVTVPAALLNIYGGAGCNQSGLDVVSIWIYSMMIDV